MEFTVVDLETGPAGSKVQYEKVLLLDIDTFPLKSLQDLFNLEAPAAFEAWLIHFYLAGLWQELFLKLPWLCKVSVCKMGETHMCR